MSRNPLTLARSVKLARDHTMSVRCQSSDICPCASPNAARRAVCIMGEGHPDVQNHTPPNPRTPVAGPLLVFVLAALCAGLVVWALERQERAQQRTQVADLAGDHVQALQRAIELSLSANNALVALVRQGNGQVTQFEEIGTQMLPFYPGIAAMGLSPDGVVRQVVPRQGNESLLGFDQLNDPRQGPEAARARQSGRLTLAGPVELVQGGLGVVGRQPVYLEDSQGHSSFWGSPT